ncbi:uncharacterized protein LOC123540819 [Mercenaria mercenaria]|uniref:uncharacterized protein LOC123540819 n=1 Tax=Mercenaria mercenaria TaxID=6596 RepID=UPI00234F4153|nr:uncharacterized protein LOC123540819 [Mercenaria mercenaria]
MPEVVYMKNDQKMELIEKPRKVVDDDMMYFCNQDDVDDNESYESLFEGFDGQIINNSNTISDSGIEQSESIVSERSVSEALRDRGSVNECRKVEESMDKLKLKLEKKMTGLSLQLNESDSESGVERSFTEVVEDTSVREKENEVVDVKLGDEIKNGADLDGGQMKNESLKELGDLKLDLSSVKDENVEGYKLSEEHKLKKRRSHETIEQLMAS